MESEHLTLTIVTAPSQQVAETLARTILEERLAACVNMLPGTRSLYWWEGGLESDEEVLMLIKGRERDVPQLQALIIREHPYSVPEIISFAAERVSDKYFQWMINETRK